MVRKEQQREVEKIAKEFNITQVKHFDKETNPTLKNNPTSWTSMNIIFFADSTSVQEIEELKDKLRERDYLTTIEESLDDETVLLVQTTHESAQRFRD